ncbi:MAG: hypothetical protein ABIT96_06485 [Ferruginibacter sp.]
MLSLKQEQFLNYWDLNRQHLGTTTSKILRGLPMAFIFGLPILLLLAVIYFFLPEWYYKISNVTTGSIITAVIAVFIAILFMSYFRMHFKWEMNEQLYRELLQKKITWLKKAS